MSGQANMLAFFLGGHELIVIAVVGLVLLFGGKRIPELARSVGRSIVEFKAGMKDSNEKSEEPAEKKEAASGDEASQ